MWLFLRGTSGFAFDVLAWEFDRFNALLASFVGAPLES
jgi:hypothetical protein